MELLGGDKTYCAVWNWTHDLAEAQGDPPTAERSRVALDVKQIEIDADVAEAEFLVDAGGYLTALARRELNDQLDYGNRNNIEKWFQTVATRIDRFHSYWSGSQTSARRWLQPFTVHYNHDRPNQAMDGNTPVEEVLNLTAPLEITSRDE